MKKIGVLSAALCLAFLLASVSFAEEAKTVTLEGKMVCAKCALHEEGRTECQNVLVVEKGEHRTQYYIAKNAAYDSFGEVCDATPKVRATGQVKQEKGQTWLVASEIKRVEG